MKNKIHSRHVFVVPCLCGLMAWGTLSAQERIVTAGSAATEIVCALGFANEIVATDRTSLYPAEMQQLPSIGYRDGIGAEGIISLKPGLVIAERGYVKEGVLAQLASAGVETLVIETGTGLETTWVKIRAVSKALGKEAAGEALVGKIKSQLEEASQLWADVKQKPRVLCVYNRGTGSVSMAGNNTFADLLPLAGAENALAGVTGYKPLNTEALIAANPGFLLFFDSGLESLNGPEGALKLPGVAQTHAGKNKKILGMEGILISNWGPRLGEAVLQLTRMLHGNTAH